MRKHTYALTVRWEDSREGSEILRILSEYGTISLEGARTAITRFEKIDALGLADIVHELKAYNAEIMVGTEI